MFWLQFSRVKTFQTFHPPSWPENHTKNHYKDLLNDGNISGSEVWIHYALKKIVCSPEFNKKGPTKRKILARKNSIMIIKSQKAAICSIFVENYLTNM